MTENLKSARFLHNLLILVCAAFIFFAFAPDRDRRYSRAEHELANYSRLSYNDYMQYLYSLMAQDEQREGRHVVEMLRQGGYHVAADASFNAPMWANPINIGGSLGTFCRLAQGQQKITVAHVVQDYSGPLRPFESSKLAVEPDAQGIVTAIFLGSGPDMNTTPHFQILSGTPTGFPVSSSLVLSIRGQGGEQKLSSLRIAYISGPSKTGYFGKDWLKTVGYASHMIEGSRCLPDSLQIFPEIEGMSPGDALRYLASQREAEKKNDIEISSLRIDSETVGWAAPIILGVLLLFFVSHLRHVRFLARKSAGAKDFPWVGLFTDWLGTAIAYATVFVLPALSEFLLRNRVTPTSYFLRYFAPIVIALFSIWATIELWHLRKVMKFQEDH